MTSQGKPPIFTEDDPAQKQYVVDVVLRVASDSTIGNDRSAQHAQPAPAGDAGQVVVLAVSLTTVQSISQYRIKMPNNLRQVPDRNSVFRAINEVLRRSPGGPPLLDPIRNQGIQDKSFKDLVKVRSPSAPVQHWE